METGANSPASIMKKFLIALSASLVLVCGTAFAAPSVQQIEAAMSHGNWQEADAGLQQVLAAHPNSARAHYLYAQVLNREGQFEQALAQINQAKTLDPQVRFTSPSRFAQVQARLRADAMRFPLAASSNAAQGGTVNPLPHPATGVAPLAPVSPAGAAAQQHAPSKGLWAGLIVVVVGIVFALRRTLSRAKSSDSARADTDRRDQLKRATDLLNDVRSLKLDTRLSTAPGHETLEKEVEDFETQLRTQVEAMTNGNATLPPGQLDELESQFAGLKARADGRPDPNAQRAAGAGSAYAREANANFGNQAQPPYPNMPSQQQQPQPVVIQQGGGLFGGGGLGGLLGGVLLGQVLGGGRDRVVERDVIVNNDAQQGGGLDFGQGSDWGDGGSGGGMDFGNNDSGGGWDNS